MNSYTRTAIALAAGPELPRLLNRFLGSTVDPDTGRTTEQGKPPLWYQRRDKDGTQIACSRACIDIIAAATGKTRVILPW